MPLARNDVPRLLQSIDAFAPPVAPATAATIALVDEELRLSSAFDVQPVGSMTNGTATIGNSGLDLLLVLADPVPRPSRALRELQLLCGQGCRRRRRGVCVALKCGVDATLIPAIATAKEDLLCVPHLREDRWLKTLALRHTSQLRHLHESDRAIIRFVKACRWNSDRRLEPFLIETIALRAFGSTAIPFECHWRLKWFFEEAATVLKENVGHPLEDQVARLESASDSLRSSIERCRDIASQAWFVCEAPGSVSFKQVQVFLRLLAQGL